MLLITAMGRLCAVFFFVLQGCFSNVLPTTLAKQAIVIDLVSNDILFEKNAHEPMEPASMTKVMTAYAVLKKIKEGHLSLSTLLTVGDQAPLLEGTKMFLHKNEKVTVEDLLKGLLIISGNDAAVVLAEGISGTEQKFCNDMTALAHSMGAQKTSFKNANGLPQDGHMTTAYDMALLCQKAILEFDKITEWCMEKSFKNQFNRNRFLWKNVGCQGLKTGHAKQCGYGIVATFKTQNRHILMLIHGLSSENERLSVGMDLLNWTLSTHETKQILKKDHKIKTIPVIYGDKDELPVTVKTDAHITMTKGSTQSLTMSIDTPKIIDHPVQAGDTIGHVIFKHPSFSKDRVYPLIATCDIHPGSIFKKIKDWFNFTVFKKYHVER
jgi:D-alanyl-D-alanine carboxypeptidase (penicillin-binding protein 5/6)